MLKRGKKYINKRNVMESLFIKKMFIVDLIAVVLFFLAEIVLCSIREQSLQLVQKKKKKEKEKKRRLRL